MPNAKSITRSAKDLPPRDVEDGILFGNLRSRTASIVLQSLADEMRDAADSGAVNKHMAGRFESYRELLVDLLEDVRIWTDEAQRALRCR